MVSVAIAQFCCCSMKATTDNTQMNGHGYVPIKLYLQKQMVGQIWYMSCSLPVSALEGQKSILFILDILKFPNELSIDFFFSLIMLDHLVNILILIFMSFRSDKFPSFPNICWTSQISSICLLFFLSSFLSLF